jgi:DNA-binding response OmpR family regulator
MIEIKALVADDDAQLQDIMVRRLQKAGLDPDRANDGQMALDLIEKNNYDLIVTDIYMPGVTGLELLRRVKEKDPHCQVIVVTASATLDNAVEALNKGAFGYMTKPFDHISVFNNMIARALEFRKLILANQRLAAAQRRRGDLLEAEVTDRVQQLRQRHKELMDLLGALPDGVLVVGKDGRILLRSPIADKWLTLELKSENQPIRDFIVKAHTAGGSWETQVRLGLHLLNLRSEELPAVDEHKRRVVIIREIGEQEVEFDSRLLDPLAKIQRSIDWLEKNQQRSDLSSSIEFLRLQIAEIEELAKNADSSKELDTDEQASSSTVGEIQGVQRDSNDETKIAASDSQQLQNGGNGHTKSGKLIAIPNAEPELAPGIIDLYQTQISNATRVAQNEVESEHDPIATKLFSEEEIDSTFKGKPEIDPVEREKAFEKLIAMLEGGAAAGVSGRLNPKNSALLDVVKSESGPIGARRDDTPWPPLPPSKDK